LVRGAEKADIGFRGKQLTSKRIKCLYVVKSIPYDIAASIGGKNGH
jgi:hypothetical protein